MVSAWTRPGPSRATARKDSRVRDVRRMWTSASRIRVRTTVPAWTIPGLFDASACLVSTSLSIIQLAVLSDDYVSLWCRIPHFSLGRTAMRLFARPKREHRIIPFYFLAWPWTCHDRKHTLGPLSRWQFLFELLCRLCPAQITSISVAICYTYFHRSACFLIVHARPVVKVVITFGSAGSPLKHGSFIFAVLLLEMTMGFYVFAWDVFVKVVSSVGKLISPYGKWSCHCLDEEDN